MTLSRGRLATAVAVTFLCGASSGAFVAKVSDEDPRPRKYLPMQDARFIETDRLDIPDEYRVPVGDQWDPKPAQEPVGWTDQRFLESRHPLITSREACFKPAPVVDEAGTIVGFFFNLYGYVARERALAPGFSIREEIAEEFGPEETGSCWPDDPDGGPGPSPRR